MGPSEHFLDSSESVVGLSLPVLSPVKPETFDPLEPILSPAELSGPVSGPSGLENAPSLSHAPRILTTPETLSSFLRSLRSILGLSKLVWGPSEPIFAPQNVSWPPQSLHLFLRPNYGPPTTYLGTLRVQLEPLKSLSWLVLSSVVIATD